MKKNYKRFLLVIIFLCLISLVSTSLAKYVLDKKESRTIESSEFYFGSNLLDYDSNEAEISEEWDITSTTKLIDFNINNYVNKYLLTKDNIKYSISVNLKSGNSSDIDYKIVDTSDNEVTSSAEITLAGGSLKEDNYKLKIEAKTDIAENSEYEFEIVVNAKEPYTKEIKITMNVEAIKTVNYRTELVNSDNDEYISLKIQIYNNVNDLTVSYDNTNLLIDKTVDLVRNVDINNDNFTIPMSSLQDNKTYEIRFIKLTKLANIDSYNITVE